MTETISFEDSNSPSQKMQFVNCLNAYVKMFENETDTDIMIQVEGRIIKAHKFVLKGNFIKSI